MNATSSIPTSLAVVATTVALAVPFDAPVVQFELSTNAESTVQPGSIVEWTITALVTRGPALGLAGFSLGLGQSAGNPGATTLAPSPSVPSGMEGFSRPAGICNPSASGGSGYGGTPVASPAVLAGTDLKQIGGVQNTFGVPAGTIGLDTNVDTAVARTAPQEVAHGSFVAPTASGSYSYSITTAQANVLSDIAAPPHRSHCAAARIVTNGSVFLSVRCVADLDDDGTLPQNPNGGVDINDLIFFLDRFEAGDPAADVDDDSADPALLDQAVDIQDLLFFLAHFENGC